MAKVILIRGKICSRKPHYARQPRVESNRPGICPIKLEKSSEKVLTNIGPEDMIIK